MSRDLLPADPASMQQMAVMIYASMERLGAERSDATRRHPDTFLDLANDGMTSEANGHRATGTDFPVASCRQDNPKRVYHSNRDD
jgi:uncharacterized protein with beta-barrel porin domain